MNTPVLPLGGAITRPLQDVTVAESQTAVLECEVANAEAEGKWMKEGQPVDFSDNVVSDVNGAVRRLSIIITRPQDVGEYSYQVANSKTTANLRVEGRSMLQLQTEAKQHFLSGLTVSGCSCSGEDQEDFEKPDGDGDPGCRVHAGTHPR